MPQNPGQESSNDDILLALETVGLANKSDIQINPATEDKQDDIINANYPSGTGDNGSVTLTNADTAYSVPSTAPTSNYTIILYNSSDTDMYVGYENSNSNGIELPSGGRMSFDLGSGQQVYTYCGTSGKVLTYSLKEI